MECLIYDGQQVRQNILFHILNLTNLFPHQYAISRWEENVLRLGKLICMHLKVIFLGGYLPQKSVGRFRD